jgi:hypothetical protein
VARVEEAPLLADVGPSSVAPTEEALLLAGAIMEASGTGPVGATGAAVGGHMV